MLIGSGCGIPGIMASRTIENDRDRKMTIMTTTFIPCGAKVPFIAMVAGAIFGGAPWVAPSAYFLGIAAIICSGIILKKTKIFEGDPAPFVMELPAYHLPTVGSVLRSMWERGWSFIKKAGTIITLSTIVIWFATYFGFVDGSFQMLAEDQIDYSLLGYFGRAISWIFIPQGWGNWQAAVASITGLVAKENIVGTLGILYSTSDASVYATMGASFTAVAGYSFLAFNLLCAPCFAAMGAIKREMNSAKWFWIAVGYQCSFAYVVSLCINQIGSLFTGGGFGILTVVAILLIIGFIYLLFRPYKMCIRDSPVIFGEPGTNGQHSFYQLLHQGTDIVPLQFVGFRQNQMDTDVVIQDSTSQQKLCANVAAQIVAFACGKADDNRNKNFEGGRPSSIIIGEQLTPEALGALLAHFENKVMFQGFLWNVNSFDQEGVQLGKVLAKRVLAHETEGALKVYSDLLNI